MTGDGGERKRGYREQTQSDMNCLRPADMAACWKRHEISLEQERPRAGRSTRRCSPLSAARRSRSIETRGFASPNRSGFALVGKRSSAVNEPDRISLTCFSAQPSYVRVRTASFLELYPNVIKLTTPQGVRAFKGVAELQLRGKREDGLLRVYRRPTRREPRDQETESNDFQALCWARR
jgi:hypothetical protein